MTAARDIHVRMGEIAIGRGPDLLRATLGSCVGIAMLWRERDVYGLAHCLLPGDGQAGSRRCAANGDTSARYVTDAVPCLLRLMNITAEARRSIEVVLAGGASMMAPARATKYGAIGDQNVRMACGLLASLGMSIVHADVGGEHGRQLIVDCVGHNYAVRTFTRPS
ncbi:chemotaxis protein CheD [Trinickia dinghuensis]|uniref:Probable chemoreceptor glutamine deamidase CheD n=1 Tax=Trinickia dinghuensis TaxID=2291023 RepID=A0A3D8JWW9_9BURK|nr:chemotaxis protein CheD [Trinickia dinghuensis]RDU97608.1 hypothetical protein DWV00_17170 [Trinickia dinghuensis]